MALQRVVLRWALTALNLSAAAEGTGDLDVPAIVRAVRANVVRVHVGLFVVCKREFTEGSTGIFRFAARPGNR